MSVVWSTLALDDLEEIGAWIARERPGTARAITLRILDAVESLALHSRLGRPGRVAGTREFAVPRTPFVIFYQVSDDVVEILRVLRGRRDKLPEA